MTFAFKHTNHYKKLRKENPTLTKNMPNVKWNQLPPTKGPDSQGLNVKPNKTILVKPAKK